MTRHRVGVFFVSVLTALGTFACAGEDKPASKDALDTEIAALLARQPRWSASVSLDASYGYRDNLLLSHADEEKSPFARGVAELVLLRMPTGPLEFTYFVRGERTHYFEGATINSQSQAWSQAELGYRLNDSVRFALPVTGYYIDDVFDVSDTEVERNIAELRVKGAMVGPAVRWTVLPAIWLEAQAVGDQKRYEDRANDGTIGEGAVRLGWIQSERLEVRLTGLRRWRNFDSRLRYSSAGRELAGRELKISEQELQLRFDTVWDEAKHWESSTRFSLLHYRDNGSGYFNYREERVDHEVEWRNEQWMLRMGGSAGRIDFGVQLVGLGRTPTARLKEEYSAELRAERKISEQWTLLAAYTWERSRSNDEFASYRVNEGLLGVRWTWEK